jgi:hypothetical protein
MSSTQQLLLGEGAGGVIPAYIEEVFSTYLYTGNSTSGGSQTITNGLDLSTKGGLVWIKGRSAAANNMLYDTVRGAGTGSGSASNKALSSNLANAQGLNSTSDYLSAFGTTGFTVTQGGSTTANQSTNYNAVTYAAWAFEKQAKFFTCKTYSGSASLQNITHDLGSVPGCIMIKKTTGSTSWIVYHRSLGSDKYMVLQTTGAAETSTTIWNNTAPTSSVFTVGGNIAAVNESGDTYVAYLFAHDAGGFGLTGTDNVISCGTFTTNGSGVGTVTLGYEPQWVLWKRSSGVGDWFLVDNMRGMTAVGVDGVSALRPNLADAELTGADYTQATSTGFVANSSASSDFIYIAIRRGPMKVPTVGTSVFAPFYVNASSGTAQTTNFPVDWQWGKLATGAYNFEANTRLLGVSTRPAYSTQPSLIPNTTAATSTGTGQSYNWTNTSFGMPDPFGGQQVGLWAWRRAPSYFDVVAYTGTFTQQTITHNLGVAPELIITKARSITSAWAVYTSSQGNNKNLLLNSTNAVGTTSTYWDSTTPTASVFSLGFSAVTNSSAEKYIAYLFATCAGVSKVGSFTGTAALQTVACGFTTGARFVLIKRADMDGSWYLWDSARGISSGNDPYFLISTADEVTGTNYVDTDTTGFKVTAAASTTVNISAATYIFLAIA